MKECPTCGSTDLRTVELAHGADFRADVNGVVPEQGNSIVECGVCNDFTVKASTSSSSSSSKP